MIRYSALAWQRRAATRIGLSSDAVALTPARQWLIGGALALALMGLTARLAYWQIGQHQVLANAAYDQQQLTRHLPSGRGMILDRNGHILALTVTRDAIVLDPYVTQSAEQQSPGALDRVAARLAALTGLPATQLRALFRLPTGYRVVPNADGTPFLLSTQGGADLRAALAGGALPGVTLEARAVRFAPAGALAGSVLGFVRADTGAGQYGVEQQYDALLTGNVKAMAITSSLSQSSAANGATVTLTLDANIQAMVEQGLHDAVGTTGAQAGTAIVVDPATGGILALAATPGFDPNQYTAAPLNAYGDPAITAVYDPGSTMKAITMAAGLDTGVITPATTLDDEGTITVGGQTISNWNQLAWGTETMTQVLAHSANVGAAWVAVDRLGPERFDHYRAAFGFGTPTGVDLPGEVAGLLPPQEPTANLAALDLAENAFGESIGVTPLQMVMAYAAIANGGTLLRPMIAQAITRGDQVQALAPTPVRRVISAQTAATLTQMLVESALHSDAQTSLITGYAVAAKTGTSTPDPQHPEITYASVLGFAPADHPRFVLLIKLDYPRTSVLGGEAAGPLWRELTRRILTYDQIPPQGETP